MKRAPLRKCYSGKREALDAPPSPRKAIRKVSAARAVQMREYAAVRIEFLKQFPACQICAVRGITPTAASEVHHIFGRAGTLLCDVRGFCSSCRGCRDWPHENPAEARRLGVLGEASLWNVRIDRHPKR